MGTDDDPDGGDIGIDDDPDGGGIGPDGDDGDGAGPDEGSVVSHDEGRGIDVKGTGKDDEGTDVK